MADFSLRLFPRICQDWLELPEAGTLRATCDEALCRTETQFRAQWQAAFPCPWGAASGTLGQCKQVVAINGDVLNGVVHHQGVNLIKDAKLALESGCFPSFAQAVRRLGLRGISLLDLASYSGHNDRTLLHYTVIFGDVGLTRWLLHHGASPNVQSHDGDGFGLETTGWTPLHHAARMGSLPLIKLLLFAGADVNVALTDPRLTNPCLSEGDAEFRSDRLGKPFPEGTTAAMIADRMGHRAAFDLLLSWPNGAPKGTRPPCLAPVWTQHSDVDSRLVRRREVHLGEREATKVALATAARCRSPEMRPAERRQFQRRPDVICEGGYPLVPKS